MNGVAERIVSGEGVKVVITSVVVVFLISAVFWAGATYQRVGNIETKLGEISGVLSRIGDVQSIVEKLNDNQKRLEKLEEKVIDLEIKESALDLRK